MNIKKIGINRADEEDLDHRTEKHVWKKWTANEYESYRQI